MKRMLIFPLLLGLLALTGCSSDRTQASEKSFFAMDTVMQFTVYGDDALLKDAQDVIADIENKASVTNPDSELYAINRDGSGVLTGRAVELMEDTLSLCQRTDGALDLSIYPIVRAWGFTTGNYQVPKESTITDLLSHVDYNQVQYDVTTGIVTLPAGMEIDLGRKYEEMGGTAGDGQITASANESEKALQLELTKFNSVMETAYEESAPHKICAYIYDLANAFNKFYHETKILGSEDEAAKKSWIALLLLTRKVLETCIDLLGFEAPEKM